MYFSIPIAYEKANEILFEQGKVIIPKKTDHPIGYNRDLVTAMGLNLASYGYVLDRGAMENLSKMEKWELSEYYDAIMKNIENRLGSRKFSKTETFYPNFPEGVMEKSEMQLYLNALVYYTGQYYFGVDLRDDIVDEEKKARLPLIEKLPREKKVLMLCTEDEFVQIMSDRVHSMGMSFEQEQQLKTFVSVFPDETKAILESDDTFASKENLIKFIGAIVENSDEKELKKLALEKIMDAPDVMRYAVYLSNKNMGIDSEHVIGLNSMDLNSRLKFKLSNQDKKQIRTMLAKCPNLYQDIWNRQNEETWKHFGRHIGWKDNGPKRVHDAFEKLYNRDKSDERNSPVLSVERQFEVAFENLKNYHSLKELGNDDPGLKLAEQRFKSLADNFPGLYMRHFLSYIDASLQNIERNGQNLYNTLKEQAYNVISNKKVAPITALELENVIRERYSSEARVFTKPNGDTQIKMNDHKDKMIPEMEEDLRQTIHRATIESLKETKNLGNVYLDPRLEDIMAPKRDIRNASDGAVLTKYSRVRGENERNLMAIGAYWKGADIDIDVSAAIYDKDYRQIGELYYGNLKKPWGVHSGDYVSAPEGASEICILDKKLLKEEECKYVAFNVRGFSAGFDKAEDGVQVIMMEKEGSLEQAAKLDVHENNHRWDMKGRGDVTFLGEVVEPTQIEYPIKLTAHATNETTFIYDVDTDIYHWVDKAGGHGLGQNIVSEDMEVRTTTEIYAIEHNTVPSMKDVITAYIEAGNGQLVNDMTKADTVFSLKPVDREESGIQENAKLYTGFDINTFSAEFCKLQNPLPDEKERGREREKIVVKDKEPEKKEEKDERTPLESLVQRAEQIRIRRGPRDDGPGSGGHGGRSDRDDR